MNTYVCVDCDSGEMTEQQARWHAHREGHCIATDEDDA